MTDPIKNFVNAAPGAVEALSSQIPQGAREYMAKTVEAGGKFAISMLTGATPAGEITLELIAPTGERHTVVKLSWEKPACH